VVRQRRAGGPGGGAAGAGDGRLVPGRVGRGLGVAGVRLRSVAVTPGRGGPEVTVVVAAPVRVGLLRLLGVVPPLMEGRAAATARLVAP